MNRAIACMLSLSRVLAITTIALIAGCGGSKSSAPTESISARESTDCYRNSPLLKWGEGLQAPSRLPISAGTGANLSGGNSALMACRGNSKFRYGAGTGDITGPVGGKIMMGNEDPMQFSTGIYTRQYARAFVIGSPCNGKRVAMVVTDTGMVFESITQAVMQRLAADPVLSKVYGQDNVMISATHTHSGPGGYSHYNAYNFFRFGYDDQTFQVIVNGILKSLRLAHANFESSPQTGPIELGLSELINGNVSRARKAYAMNPAEERAQYLDMRGDPVNTNRLVTQLKFRRDTGRDVGLINWYAVHPTSAGGGEKARNISGDNKGYAAYLIERLMGADKTGADEEFVATFAQSDEGDSFADLYVYREQERPSFPTRPDEPHPQVVLMGLKQLVKALDLYEQGGSMLTGGIDYRQFFVKMDEVTVSDATVLASLRHPPELDSQIKQTCAAAMGVGFPSGGGGGEGSRDGLTASETTCRNPLGAQLAINEAQTALAGNIPNGLLAFAVGCNAQKVPGLNLQCQAEKPVLFLFGSPLNLSPNIQPFQIFVIGNIAVVGLPWEITTMAGRRIRTTLQEALRGAGVDHVVIMGLANDYVSYLTTREEYALQQYEGASNQYGPWTLAAVQQESRRLALALRSGLPAPSGPQPPRSSPLVSQVLPLGPSDSPSADSFGALTQDVESEYMPGSTAIAVFQTGNPRSDLKTDGSYLFVEQKQANGTWKAIAHDRDPETTFIWEPDTLSAQVTPAPTSKARLIWRIPGNVKPGLYRLRHEGAAQLASGGPVTQFEGVSSVFTVRGPARACF